MPNYKKMAKANYEDARLTLARLVSIDSVYDGESVGEGAPFGKGVKEALSYIATVGENYGFSVDRCDGYCTELSYGDKGPLIGIYAHADVVPATGNWTTPPFEPSIRDGKMYARGTSDDKGPLVAALYAIKALKDNGLIRDFRVRLVAGGNEESGSECLKYYFGKLKKPDSDYGFTPDAEFPLIYAEKGIRHCYAGRLIDLKPITKMEGGSAFNAVLDRLEVNLPKDDSLIDYLKKNNVHFEESENASGYCVVFYGKSAHASTPELGENAALIAFKALGEHYGLTYLSDLSKILEDTRGRGFDGYSKSVELGESTFNYGMLSYDGHKLKVSIDYRYGENADPEAALRNFSDKTLMTITPHGESELLLYKKDSPLVKTLMKAYKKATHDLVSKPLAIGGGTYAKEANNCVAFGSAFKNHPGDIHSPDEYIYLEDLYKQIAIYMRAIYMLGHLS